MSGLLRPSLVLLTPLCLLACGGDPATASVRYPEGRTLVVPHGAGPLAVSGVEVAP